MSAREKHWGSIRVQRDELNSPPAMIYAPEVTEDDLAKIDEAMASEVSDDYEFAVLDGPAW